MSLPRMPCLSASRQRTECCDDYSQYGDSTECRRQRPGTGRGADHRGTEEEAQVRDGGDGGDCARTALRSGPGAGHTDDGRRTDRRTEACDGDTGQCEPGAAGQGCQRAAEGGNDASGDQKLGWLEAAEQSVATDAPSSRCGGENSRCAGRQG